MTSSMESNISAPWMDRAWIQEVLRDVEMDPSLSVTDCHVTDASSKGDHYLSEMQRITVHLQRAGCTNSRMSLIVKNLPAGEEMRKQLACSTAFPNEIKFFSQILPKFEAILESAAAGCFKPLAARHIHSRDTVPYFLVVTDLAPEGFRMAARQRGLELDHCLLAMKALARLHAASVALRDSDPLLVESMKENIFSEEPPSGILQGFSKPSIVSIAKLVRQWPDGGEATATKLLDLADTFCQRLRQQLSPEGNRLNVLIHGDLWTNNMLFKYNDVTGGVEDIRLVDFQLAMYSSCAIDLQYFIHTSPRDEVRVAHTEDILREYHRELSSTLQLLGQAGKAVTFRELMDEYERKGVYGFLISLFVLPLFMADCENAADTEVLMSGCNYSESSDERSSNKEFVKVMKRLLPLFEKKGFF
ncbi:uncharacterized protein LOC134531420 [Bacillus rossius redtenbacheri]|uniref:uncharacterized protein LOC134531420 n=1 Tax=Bacillus rossius redtenbacheri TaxID=93214 RepID=UPI002FDE40D8